MAEILASLDDINAHLPQDKLQATTPKVELLQLDAVRIVKGALASVFSATTLAGWDVPEDTPERIRAIAGRLIAAKLYAKAYSEDVVELPEYAQWLYDQAMADLNGVASGAIVLIEVTETVNTGSRLTDDFFFPNGDGTAEPKFTMDARF